MPGWALLGGVAAALLAGLYVLWGPAAERKKRQSGLVPGLLNLGNTCFLNALLQGLAACPAFLQWLQGHAPGHAHDRTRPLSDALLRLLQALSGAEATEESLLDASGLLEAVRSHRWNISSFEEQDAHELFHILTASLEDERDSRPRPRVAPLFDLQALQEPQTPPKQILCRTQAGSPQASWRRQHPFHGRLASNMVCKRCGHQSPLRYDTFDSLSLSIPATVWGGPVTLEQCLRHFVSSESVSGVECESCNKVGGPGKEEGGRSTFVKQLRLGKLPGCLCLHLQRLSWSGRGGRALKRQERVLFGETLALRPFRHTPHRHAEADPPLDGKAALANGACPAPPSALPDHSSGSCSYRLMAVVVHHGDMHSGHFVTFRRSPTSPHWLWASDDVVRRSSLQEVLASSAYLLFYERIQDTTTTT
nr:PREDICTED: ubiquitin carboxyl-terminal hydrolase 30 [Anolis carolinensis]|eukprot:XP_008123551.1 PREDICTED: ubiquitin carboxyl-terminal hydrolase 30 [Anolis carolinensis]